MFESESFLQVNFNRKSFATRPILFQTLSTVKMAFITNVDDLQAPLNACVSVQDFGMLVNFYYRDKGLNFHNSTMNTPGLVLLFS